MKQPFNNNPVFNPLKARERLALVASRFNSQVCDGLIKGVLDLLADIGIREAQVDVFRVPGAFEIPLAAKRCAELKKYKGIICLGAVIRGETPHFDYICRAVTDGLRQVGLDFSVPIGFGVVTTNTVEQALARSRDDSFNKGKETAVAVLETIQVLKEIK